MPCVAIAPIRTQTATMMRTVTETSLVLTELKRYLLKTKTIEP